MLSVQFQPLRSDDCLLLTGIFEQEAAQIFPVPATVRLYVTASATGTLAGIEVQPSQQQEFSFATDTPVPRYHAGSLYIPLILTEGQIAWFVISGADPLLLQKFSSDWLLEFQERLNRMLQVVRYAYIDSETDLYNSRALTQFLRFTPETQHRYSVYLVSTFFTRRTSRSSCRKVHYLAGLLSTISQGVLFFLGQGVFALVVVENNRQQRLAFAHYLQRRLKREGLQKVHVAFTDFQQGNEGVYDEVWRALAIAERRGPFGLCDTAALKKAEQHPFALPDDELLRTLRRLWRGVERFSLAIFAKDKVSASSQPLTTLLSSLLHEQEHALALSSDQVFVLFPHELAASAIHRAKTMVDAVADRQQVSLSAGVSCFPCLQNSKTDTIRNCRKALFHGTFYGPGSIVAFDHLSFNVSGDWYFDEGDFRQAVKEYSQGLKLKPGERNLLNSLGVALMEMKKHNSAIASFSEVLQKHSDDYMALVNLGYAYQMKERNALALDCFEKAYTVQKHLDIDGMDVYPQLSRLYCRSGRFNQALPVLLRWRQYEGEDGDFLLHRLLGEVYSETGQPTEAMKSLQRALQLYPHDVESMSMLGLLYVEHNEGEEAGLLLLQKALAIDDIHPDSWYRYSRALHALSREKDALDSVRRCLHLKGKHPRARLLLGEILASTGKVKQAAAVFHRVLVMKNIGSAEKKAAEKAVSTLAASIH